MPTRGTDQVLPVLPQLVDLLPDGVVVLNHDHRFLYVNRAASTLLGRDAEELIGREFSSQFASHERQAIDEQLTSAPEAFWSSIRQEPNDALRAIECKSQLLHRDGKLYIVVSLHDVSEIRHVMLRAARDLEGQLRESEALAVRVQAEEWLREAEERYRGIFEATTDGLVINDPEGIVIDANPAFCRMHGYSRDEMIGRHPTTFVHPDYLDRLAAYFEEVSSGRSYQTQAVDLRKDGSPVPIEVHGTSFMYRGRPHLLGVVRDISERVQAAEQLQEKEAQYRSIFEATTDGLIIGNLEGSVVEANPAACRMYGYSYEEFIGLHTSAFIHPDHIHLVGEVRRNIEAGSGLEAQSVNMRKDGTPFYVEARATELVYRGTPHVLVVVRDITERVRSEAELREKEEQHRGIFEATSDGLVINDLDEGIIVEANPAYCKMHGYTHDEIVGMPSSAVVDPHLHHELESLLRTIKAGGNVRTQGRNLRKDGTSFPTEVHGTRFTYRGKPHVLAVVRDISERVQAYELLEQRVAERTRELTTLLDVSHNVASTLELRPLLGLILDQLRVVAEYTGSSILILDDEDFTIVDARGPEPEEHILGTRFPRTQAKLIWDIVSRRQSIIVDDVRGDTPEAASYREVVGDLLDTTFTYIRSWLGVPMMLKDRVIGMLALSHREPGFFTQHHASLALAIANQAAIAIENAQLYEQAQFLAALEERQRLARELHDSVSQALYGIALGARTARTLLDRDPGQVAEPLEYVLAQAEAGLAEMRALIFELRPEALETEGLVAALEKQVQSMRSRHGVTVYETLDEEPSVPFTVKEALYRIAQEALHNTIKHARAQVVHVALTHDSNELLLEIRDDGSGFDPEASFPGHLGLRTMRERVVRLGGSFEIESGQGFGTCIRARVTCRSTT